MVLEPDKTTGKVIKKAMKSLRRSQVAILATEEISELITELSLHQVGDGDYDDLCEEVADCRIMINLVMRHLEIDYEKIRKRKKKFQMQYWTYINAKPKKENIESVIWELAGLQKVICKSARKRKNKEDIIDKIVAVELSFEYLTSIGLIRENDCYDWYAKKINRMQKRITKHNLI